MPILIKGSGGGAQKTPVISVSSGGLITATAGSKSATKQLSTQGAKTVTPTDYEQTVVSAGVYTTGAVKVAAATFTPTVVATSATARWDSSLGQGVVTFSCNGITPSSKILSVYGVCNRSGNTATLGISYEAEVGNNVGNVWLFDPADDEFSEDDATVTLGHNTISLTNADFREGDDCELIISFI